MTDGLLMLIDDKQEPAEEYSLPKYSDPGRILVRIDHVYTDKDRPHGWVRYELEVLDYDSDSSVCWIQEGVGFDDWLNDHCDFPKKGLYVVEGITGTYHRGNWSWGDDDSEDWEFERIRKATWREWWTKALR